MTLAAALLLFAAQAPEPRIEVRATTLEKALPEIGQKLGVPMRAAPAIGRELVLVSCASKDAAAFRDQMAKAFSAEWRQDENGAWVLNRSTQLRDAERRTNREKRLERIRKTLAKARKIADPDSNFDAATAEGLVKDLKGFMELPKPKEGNYDAKYYGKARNLDLRGPSHRIVRRLMDKLPVEMLDNEGSVARTVYSTRPTKMQLPMPFDVMPEVRRYVQEQNLWAEAMSASEVSQENGGAMYTSLVYRKERVEKAPGVVILVVQDRYGSRQLSLKAYDTEGKQLLDESEGVAPYDQEEQEALQQTMKDAPRRVKVEFSPESKRYAEVFDQDANRRKTKGITPADYAPYFDVVARDPLSYGASDITLAIARGENRNLIARLDDTFYYLTYVAQQPELSKNGEIDASILSYFTTSIEEDGWTRLLPRDLDSSARVFYDRRDLARVLALGAQGGRMTVERQAELALVTPDNPNEKPLSSMVSILSGNRSWGGDEFLRLYGTLTPQERKAAASESGLSFSRLSGASLTELSKLAYLSDEWRLQYNPSEALRATFKEGNDPNQELFWGGYLREPTFSLPDGLKSIGTIKITGDTMDKVKTGPISMKWGQQEGQIMTAEELAENWYQNANPKRFPWAQDEWSRRNVDTMTIVNQQSVNIEVRFDERITTSSVLTSEVPIDGGPFTLRTLPKAFQEAYAKKLKELDEQYKDQPVPNYGDYRRNGGQNEVPPPAR